MATPRPMSILDKSALHLTSSCLTLKTTSLEHFLQTPPTPLAPIWAQLSPLTLGGCSPEPEGGRNPARPPARCLNFCI